MTPAEERIGWLECLIAEYTRLHDEREERHQEEHGEGADEDPSATAEMLGECKALAKELRARLAPPEAEAEAAPVGDDDEIPF